MQAEPVSTISAVFESDEASVADAARCFRARALGRGETLFRQGESCKTCWIVVEGTLSLASFGVEGQEAQVATFGPGEFAGAFPDPSEQAGELSAQTRSDVIEIATERLLDLAESQNVVAKGLAVLLARQQRNLIDRLANRLILSAAGRVYAELLRLADGTGRIAPAPVVTALSLRVNTARETASRAIAAAERRGMLQRDAESWIVLAPRLLRDQVV